MAEVQSRPAASRGRGSGRGGRGGLSSRGGRASSRSHPNGGDKHHDDAFDDDQELATLKKQYSSQISQLKDMFPNWSDTDLVMALQDSNGNVEVIVDGIVNGSISQWGEVSNHKKSHARSKPKEAPMSESSGNARPARGGRSPSDSTRGRGRATERGGRGGRGRTPSHAATNGSRTKENTALSVPTETAWATTTISSTDDALGASAQDNASASGPSKDKEAAAAPATAAAPAAPKPSTGPVKTWAAILQQSTAPKSAPKPVETPTPKPVEPVEPLSPTPAEEPEEPEPVPVEPEPPAVESEPEPALEEEPPAVQVPTVIEPEIILPPSKDQLTETNLEQVADTSNPPATATAASTAADSWDPRQPAVSATATPISASQQQHARAAGSGYAASAQKATERTPRGIGHHQRRVLEQEEAVRMPGNREVDRAAIKFGGFTLEDEDIDDEREEPETRAQPPADSPTAPRASLPPVQAQAAPAPESFPTAKATGTLPPTGPAAATAATAATASAVPSGPPASAPTQPAAAATAASVPAPQQPTQPNQQFGRFGQAGVQDQASFPQKPFDSFGQQPPTAPAAQLQSQLDSSLQGQVSQASIQQPSGAATGAFTSGPNEYSSFYTADQSNRAPYNTFYHQQQYGQQQGGQGQAQQGQGQQDSVPTQQRSFGGYNASQNENLSQYPQSTTQHSQSRFGAGAGSDVQNSGHNTPNPTAQNQPSAPGNQGQTHVQQQPHNSQYPYNQHPYYNSPYYSQYMGYGGQYGQGGYGAGPYGKGGLYGQPHQYGMSPQGPFDHSSSGSGGFGQGSLHRGDSGIGSGLADYRSTSATQTGNQPGIGGNSGFGGMHDSFGRGGSGYPSQAGQGYNAQSSQPGNAGAGGDDLKPFGDTKTTGGPSPSLSSAARPGSAANNPSQGGLPPPQTNQQAGMGGMGGYGGYPSHLQGHGLHGTQTGNSGYGMGGGTSQHNSNFTPYNQYGGNYYGNQRGGWGGNYH